MDLSILYGRMLSMIGVGRVTASQAAASSGARGLQVRFDETEAHDGLPVVQQYGVASRPQDGADAIVIFPGGDRSRGIVIAVNDRRYQLDLSPGEVALHDDQGQIFRIGRAGIVIDGGGKPMEFRNTPSIKMDTPLLEVTGDVKIGSRTFNTHTHPTPAGLSGTPS
jgi:phage gp45-like